MCLKTLSTGVAVAFFMVSLPSSVHAGLPEVEEDGAAVEPPKAVTISIAISTIRREVMDDRRREGAGWPRDEPDFAAEKNWTVPNDQLIQALTRRLDRNPALDGYIKWQLMGFGPDLSRVEDRTVTRLTSTAPDPLEQPEPEIKKPSGRGGGGGVSMSLGRQYTYVADLEPVVGDGVVAYNPKIATATSGIHLGASDGDGGISRAVVRRANEKLREARDAVDVANQPVRAYRDALIRSLPTGGGLRLGAMLQDVRDRAVAGDPSTPRAMDRLMAEAETLAADPTITPRTRRTLRGWAQALSRIRTPIFHSVDLNQKGEPTYDGEYMTLREDDVERLVGYLRTPSGGSE